MSYGIKISLEGYDVKTATPEQCSIHSDYPCIKTKMGANPSHFGIYPYTWTSNPPQGTTNILIINHYLGYTPAHLAMAQAPMYYGVPPVLGGYSGEMLPWYSYGSQDYYDSYCNGTSLVIYFYRGSSLSDYDYTGEQKNFKYYIFVENGA